MVQIVGTIFNIYTLLARRPRLPIYSCCFIAFTIQLVSVADKLLNPYETYTNIEQRKLREISFPIIFKICIKPGLDEAELNKSGYDGITNYFRGRSKYNSSLIGWAGHTKEGGIFGVDGR